MSDDSVTSFADGNPDRIPLYHSNEYYAGLLSALSIHPNIGYREKYSPLLNGTVYRGTDTGFRLPSCLIAGDTLFRHRSSSLSGRLILTPAHKPTILFEIFPALIQQTGLNLVVAMLFSRLRLFTGVIGSGKRIFRNYGLPVLALGGLGITGTDTGVPVYKGLSCMISTIADSMKLKESSILNRLKVAIHLFAV